MKYASGYSLDLYCDSVRNGPHTQSTIDGKHGYSEFPHNYIGETFGECARQARRDGWIIRTDTRTATCPKCSGKRLVLSPHDGKATP